MCRVKSQKANYRHHIVETGNFVIDRHDKKTKTDYRQALVEENNNNEKK
jgi:hypothetical protein